MASPLNPKVRRGLTKLIRESNLTDKRTAPTLILAADHRGRGVITIENYKDYVRAVRAALPACDGVLATYQPLLDLSIGGDIGDSQSTYLSINRTGLAGSVFELDDRLVASVERASTNGWTGIKHMTRIDMGDPLTAGALELLGQVLESASSLGVEALIEPLAWHNGAVLRETNAIVHAAVIAHDLGAPLIKVPIPAVAHGLVRRRAIERIVSSVGVPVLFLGGPHSGADRVTVLEEVRDAMAGGAAGMAMGRTIFQDHSPAEMAQLVSEIVHS